jgi:hypothetical protein
MDLIINKDNIHNNMVNMGKDKINNNDFMKDLSDLMENEQFSNFFKKYMTDWDTLKCTTIYMRLYSEFKDKYNEISGKKLDKHIIIYLLSKIMTDNILRPFTIETIKKVQQENNKIDFFDEFEDFLKTTCLN